MTYLLIPLIIIGALLVLFGVVFALGRIRGGRYLRPIVTTLARVGFMRRWFERMSAAAIERSNPELASAMRKLKRVGPNPDPARAQQALSQLSVDERRAYMDAMQEQGAMPEPANRQQRRLQERMQQGSKPAPSGGGAKKTGKPGAKPGKKRR